MNEKCGGLWTIDPNMHNNVQDIENNLNKLNMNMQDIVWMSIFKSLLHIDLKYKRLDKSNKRM